MAVLLKLNQILARAYVDNLWMSMCQSKHRFSCLSGSLCYLYMQEHLISNFAAHTTAGHLFTDNVTTFA